MIVKHLNFNSSVLTIFDLVGDDETALTKALAFIFSKDRNVLFKFLRDIGIRISNTENNFKNTLIQIENRRDEGRTDLEISNANIFHLIIEAKVRKNKVTKQRSKYLTAFNDKCKQNVFCILSHYRDSNIELNENVRIKNLSWIDLINILDCKDFQDNELLKDFMRYAMKKYKLNEQKEILVQDLYKESEIQRFKEYHVYRRDVTYGTPFYFAPYFTRAAKQPEGEGIVYLARILGVLTLRPIDVEQYIDDLRNFCDNDDPTVQKWKKGVQLSYSDADQSYAKELRTCYFLEEPLRLSRNLLKDGGNKKGRGKNWISAMIPKNRCVTFHEFAKRLMPDND